MAYRKGWDCFSAVPGEFEELSCRVCGEKLDVRRNVEGPTSSVEAMAGRKHLHDSFTCKNSNEKWHRQALSLFKLAEDTPSAILANQLTNEALEIIRTKQHTKEHWPWYEV